MTWYLQGGIIISILKLDAIGPLETVATKVLTRNFRNLNVPCRRLVVPL